MLIKIRLAERQLTKNDPQKLNGVGLFQSFLGTKLLNLFERKELYFFFFDLRMRAGFVAKFQLINPERP